MVSETGDQWDLIGHVISSRYRITVLRRLDTSPATPSRIADDAGTSVSHVSRALNEFRDKGLVELLVSDDKRKGRIYDMTDQGQEVWDAVQSQGLVDDANT